MMSVSVLDAPVPKATGRPLAASLSARGWLLLGMLVLPFVGMRFNVAALAWVAPVPFLLYLRQTDGWRSRLWFMGALQLAMFLQYSKIVTDPVPWFFAALFSVPLGLFSGGLYIGFESLRRRLGDRAGLWLLPALVVAGEWIGWSTSEFGSWGATAYTQIDNLALLQTVSVFGLSGIAWLVTAVAAWLAVALSASEPRRWLRHGLALAALVVLAHTYGAVRLYTAPDAKTVPVAAVVSDLGLSPAGMPTDAELAANTNILFERSALAAARGARVIAWNEGATAVYPDQEETLLARGQELSTETGADLVVAYIVPFSREEVLPYVNKYVWLTPEGPAESYLKHHPVPGEGAVRGTAPIVALDRPYGRVAGAICYDYDFPSLGQEHAALGTQLAVVPSSDWRGIDPFHTQMAAIRGIEGGYSVLRPVRWATSTATDAYGRVRGSLSYFELNDRVLVAQVPITQVQTVYAAIGDALPWTCLVGLLWAGLAVIRRRARPEVPA